MSIIRVGLAETKNYAEGYDAIFGKKKEETAAKEAEPTAKKNMKDKKKDSSAKK